ncbi:Hypothetical predicted protein [Cloeon dipterum]|uniref:Uncharacterized protein n=1 Tax=Cloeon dipterum TaxID=197152 RepID=A0A8S1C0G4_9INSE|nr:Hypothetical predicted protein [Cloeon dipterum]
MNYTRDTNFSSALEKISKDILRSVGEDLIARGIRTIDPILGLILALQLKVLLSMPLFVLAAGLIGLKSLAASLVSVFFSGASLLRTVMPATNTNGNGSNGRPAGASSRVAYEVRSPPQNELGPYVYPPSALGVITPSAARQPDVRIISAAANN